MKKYILLVVGVAILTAAGCGGSNRNSQKTITVTGAFALYPLMVKWVDEFKAEHPDVSIDVSAGGAGKGMTDVLANMSDIAMVSREVYPQEKEKGAMAFAVAKDAVVAIVNAENPLIKDIIAKGISNENAKKIWISESIKSWGDLLGNGNKTQMNVYTRSDACGAAETWAGWFGTKQEDLAGVQVFGDPGIVAAVQNDKFAIGYANIGYAYDAGNKLPNKNIVVLPIDIDGNGKIDASENFCSTKDQVVTAIETGVYPSPPARDLYLVTNGKPQNPNVVKFIRYILKDGQKENIPAGYVGMSSESISESLKRLRKGK